MLHTESSNKPYTTILLAEDCPDTQMVLLEVLKNSGAAVTCVNNGKQCLNEALSALAHEHPYDLILMDIQMPVMDGLSATRELREHGYTLPIVAITARSTPEDESRSLHAGCNEHLSKLSGTKSLLSHVEKYLHDDAHEANELPVLPLVPEFLHENPSCISAALAEIAALPGALNDLKQSLAACRLDSAQAALCNLGQLSLYGYSLFSTLVAKAQMALEAKDWRAAKRSLPELERAALAIMKGATRLRHLEQDRRGHGSAR